MKNEMNINSNSLKKILETLFVNKFLTIKQESIRNYLSCIVILKISKQWR